MSTHKKSPALRTAPRAFRQASPPNPFRNRWHTTTVCVYLVPLYTCIPGSRTRRIERLIIIIIIIRSLLYSFLTVGGARYSGRSIENPRVTAPKKTVLHTSWRRQITRKDKPKRSPVKTFHFIIYLPRLSITNNPLTAVIYLSDDRRFIVFQTHYRKRERYRRLRRVFPSCSGIENQIRFNFAYIPAVVI